MIGVGRELHLSSGSPFCYHEAMTPTKVSVVKKKIGRPRTGIGTLIGLRWHEPALEAIDEWRRQRPDLPSRAAAIRRLVELGLKAPSTPKWRK